jgi:hypothetical protein
VAGGAVAAAAVPEALVAGGTSKDCTDPGPQLAEIGAGKVGAPAEGPPEPAPLGIGLPELSWLGLPEP